MKRVLLASLVTAVAVMCSGCCEFCTFVHSPFGPGTLCDPTHWSGCGLCDGGPCGCGTCGGGPCGAGPCGFVANWGCGPAACCEPQCGPGAGCGDCCGMVPDCGSSCGGCGPVCGNPCGCCNGGYGCGCTCGCGCGGPGPLACVLRLFHPTRWFGCYNNGCGEIYWGDFHGDPPDCCDPCNCMGDYTGCTSSCGGCGCMGGGDCGCAGAPAGNYGVPSQGMPSGGLSAPQDAAGESRSAEPTKAPVVPPAKSPYYTGRRPQYRQYPQYRNRMR